MNQFQMDITVEGTWSWKLTMSQHTKH